MIRKRSKEKQAILEFLKGTTLHPTADVIYTEMRKANATISLGTVYRNLRLLKEEGEITELDLARSLSHFDGDTRPHYHFRCVKCGRVFDVEAKVDENLDKRVAEKTGFKVLNHITEFRGVCLDCQI